MYNAPTSSTRKPFLPVTPNGQPTKRTPKSKLTQTFESATRTNGKTKTPRTLEKATPINKRGRKKDDHNQYKEMEPASKIAKAHGIATELVPQEEAYDGLLVVEKTKTTPIHKRGRKEADEDKDKEIQPANKIARADGVATESDALPLQEEEYEGPLVDGQRHGEGTLIDKNGDTYVGPFVRGKRHGLGTVFLKNGDKFVGNFVDDVSMGQGTLIRKSDGAVLELKYQNAKGDGQLLIKYATEDKLEATYIDGIGTGTLTYANGDVYVGGFFGELPHGEGTLSYKNGGKYVGTFNEGKPHGKGTLYSANEDQYVGEFLSGRFTCKEGRIFYKNGDKYVGECLNELPDGQGTLFLKNGSKYVGGFEKGKKHGFGKMTYIGRPPMEGNFIHDLFDVSSARKDWDVYEDGASN
jgi:hypothetical protein